MALTLYKFDEQERQLIKDIRKNATYNYEAWIPESYAMIGDALVYFNNIDELSDDDFLKPFIKNNLQYVTDLKTGEKVDLGSKLQGNDNIIRYAKLADEKTFVKMLRHSYYIYVVTKDKNTIYKEHLYLDVPFEDVVEEYLYYRRNADNIITKLGIRTLEDNYIDIDIKQRESINAVMLDLLKNYFWLQDEKFSKIFYKKITDEYAIKFQDDVISYFYESDRVGKYAELKMELRIGMLEITFTNLEKIIIKEIEPGRIKLIYNDLQIILDISIEEVELDD